MMYHKSFNHSLSRTLILAALFCLPVYLFPVSLTSEGDTSSACPVQFLSRYLQIPSVTGSEGPAGVFFADACREAGLHVQIFSDRIDSYNFAASLYPLSSGMPNIVLITHIDVVPSGDPAMWTHPPFSGAVADSIIWGRGAIDNKGHGVMQFFALKHFVERASAGRLPYNFTLLAVSNEEEMGSLGAEYVVNNFLDILNPVAVYGEGGGGIPEIIEADPSMVIFGIETVQKRVLWFQLQANGASRGHGSLTNKYCPVRETVMATNAVLSYKSPTVLTPTVRKMFIGMGDHETGVRRFAMKNASWVLPLAGNLFRKDELVASLITNTITLTSIRSDSTAHNQVAQGAVARFDTRLLPGTDQEEFLADIRKRIRKFNVELVVVYNPVPSVVSEEGIYFRAMERAIHLVYPGVAVIPMLFPAVNDNRFFRHHNIPTYGITPAVFSRELIHSLHNFDERIPVKALLQGIEVYKGLIRNLIGEHGHDKV
jgi:carboxypeptidase PM20D1